MPVIHPQVHQAKGLDAMSNMRTIDQDKLEAEIEKEKAVLASLTQGARGGATRDLELAIRIYSKRAEVDALIGVLNSLR